jgi:hypothetical protein
MVTEERWFQVGEVEYFGKRDLRAKYRVIGGILYRAEQTGQVIEFHEGFLFLLDKRVPKSVVTRGDIDYYLYELTGETRPCERKCTRCSPSMQRFIEKVEKTLQEEGELPIALVGAEEGEVESISDKNIVR